MSPLNKTILFFVPVLIIAVLFYAGFLFIMGLGFFVMVFMLPTKLYKWFKELEDFNRIRKEV